MLKKIQKIGKDLLKQTNDYYKKVTPPAAQKAIKDSIAFLGGLLNRAWDFAANAANSAYGYFQNVKNQFSSNNENAEQASMLGSIPTTAYNTAASAVNGVRSNVTYLYNYVTGNQSESESDASADDELRNKRKHKKR